MVVIPETRPCLTSKSEGSCIYHTMLETFALSGGVGSLEYSWSFMNSATGLPLSNTFYYLLKQGEGSTIILIWWIFWLTAHGSLLFACSHSQILRTRDSIWIIEVMGLQNIYRWDLIHSGFLNVSRDVLSFKLQDG